MTRDFSSRGRSPRAGGGLPPLVLVGVVALCLSLGHALAAWEDARDARAQRAAAVGAAVEADARIRQLGRRDPDERLADRAAATVHASPALVVAGLSRCLPRGARLVALDLRYGDPLVVEARVVARDAATYGEFLERLVASPLFRDVVPSEETRADQVASRVRMNWAGTP